MSLLMEALKKAEAAKLTTTPLVQTETSLAMPAVIEEPPEEILDEVSAWQQQLLAETSERSAFILEEAELKQPDITDDEESPLVEMLVTEPKKEIDWEAGILPEFQAILATEPVTEPIVLEDNHSNLHLEEEPHVDLKSDTLATVPAAPTLSFSREIEPDLSLEQLHQETPAVLKLDWDDAIAVEPPTSPTLMPKVEPLSPRENATAPPLNKNSAESAESVRVKQVESQRQEIKRLFKASARTSSYRWVYLTIMIVVLGGILGFYGMQHEALLTYYISLLNNQLVGESLVVNLPPAPPFTNAIPAHPIESTIIKPADSHPPVPTPPKNVVDTAPKSVTPATPEPQPTELAVKSIAPVSDKKNAPSPPVAPPALEKPEKLEKVAVKPSSPPSKPIEPNSAIAMAQVPKNTGIQITRALIKPRLHQNLTQAYAAFQRGENNHASTAYQTVLQQEPRNRDALLGMAAIAVRQGNYPQARHYYQEVLKYYPQDPVAQTNLLSIAEQINPEDRETQLKTLTRTAQQPEYVYFQLGLVYAQQNRWNEAQQAFFEAYRLDSQQADYAYNLAVSLDYLHQSQAAVTYYQRAIQLQQKQGKSRSFEPKVVQQRVNLLKTSTSGREVASLLEQVE